MGMWVCVHVRVCVCVCGAGGGGVSMCVAGMCTWVGGYIVMLPCFSDKFSWANFLIIALFVCT